MLHLKGNKKFTQIFLNESFFKSYFNKHAHRCTPLVNLLLSLVMFKKNEKSKPFLLEKANIAIFIMSFGVVIASIGDLKFDLNSYVYCGASVIFQSLYLSI